MTQRCTPLTPRMKHTMVRAAELAAARGNAYLGTEHVLLALLDDPEGIAGGVMHRLGLRGSDPRRGHTNPRESDGYARTSPGASASE